VDGIAPVPWEGALIDIAAALQDTTVDVVIGGYTQRITNLMVGRILFWKATTPACPIRLPR